MKQSEIDKAVNDWTDGFGGSTVEIAQLKKDVAAISFRAGAEMVNKAQPYSAEDMAKFGRYVKKKWTLIDTGGWIESDIKFYKPHDIKTDKQVIKLWEETK